MSARIVPDYRQLAPLGGDRAPLVHAYRGICAYAVGRTTEARGALELALRLGVAEPLRSQVRRRLEALDATP